MLPDDHEELLIEAGLILATFIIVSLAIPLILWICS